MKLREYERADALISSLIQFLAFHFRRECPRKIIVMLVDCVAVQMVTVRQKSRFEHPLRSTTVCHFLRHRLVSYPPDPPNLFLHFIAISQPFAKKDPSLKTWKRHHDEM